MCRKIFYLTAVLLFVGTTSCDFLNGNIKTGTSEINVSGINDPSRVIYGSDDRQDMYSVSDTEILNSADGVVALYKSFEINDNGDGTSTLKYHNYGDRFDLCRSESFWNQPSGAFCSGFLVEDDLIATAGHCVTSDYDLNYTYFVFGYKMINASTAQTTISNNEIYTGIEIVAREEISNQADYALIRLNRPVTNHNILPTRRSGAISVGDELYTIGHPSGLPIKYAGNGKVRSSSEPDYFVTNLDTFDISSGSPVFNATTHVVEGILVRGENDFVRTGSCYVVNRCSDSDCRGEDVTRSTVLPLDFDEEGNCEKSISIGTLTNGFWTTDCVSANRSGSYARYYTFSVSSPTDVQIDLVSSKDTYVFLLNGAGTNGSVITSNDDGGDGRNSRITRTLSPGTYTIEATTYDSDVTGSFTVNLIEKDISINPCERPISIDNPVNESWISDCESKNRPGSYAKYYTFSVSSSTEVQIDLESTMDTYLFLLSGAGINGAVITSNDDGGDGYNSRITKTLSPGTYTIEATTYGSGVTGNFTVTVK